MAEQKIIVVTRRTRLDELIKKFNNIAQASFYVEHLGGDIREYLEEKDTYEGAVSRCIRCLEEAARVQRIDRDFVPNYIFGREDIVVVIGQDGLVANTLKYLDGQPLIAVNPDPGRFDGVLLPFREQDLPRLLKDVIQSRRPLREITMAEAVLNDGQTILAVNDFFIGRQTHISARYRIDTGVRQEEQSSSGIIISTGLGATGWLKSVIAGANGVAAAITGNSVPLNFVVPGWNSPCLYYSVREPFPSNKTGANLVFGTIGEVPLKVMSQMPAGGVIFSDGVEQDFLQFSSGIEAKIQVAKKRGCLVV